MASHLSRRLVVPDRTTGLERRVVQWQEHVAVLATRYV
jgi:hypothetical protein